MTIVLASSPADWTTAVNSEAAAVGAVLAVVVALATFVGSALELTKIGRLRNQLAKETAILGALPDGPHKDHYAMTVSHRASLLDVRLLIAVRPWLAKKHPWIALLGVALYVALLVVFLVAGHEHEYADGSYLQTFNSQTAQNTFDALERCLLWIWAAFGVLFVFRLVLISLNQKIFMNRFCRSLDRILTGRLQLLVALNSQIELAERLAMGIDESMLHPHL